MSLPLPDLDGRVWTDLVEEALARIPRHAPEWTDYNAHDPGITIAELLAYTTEQSLYRANRVTEGLFRAFLRLAGPDAEPTGPRAARVPLAFRVPANWPNVHLPAGLILVPEPAESSRTEGGEIPGELEDPFAAPVQLLQDLFVWPSQIRSIQTTDGHGGYADLPRPRPGLNSFAAWGDDPTPSTNGPTLVIGLDPPLPVSARFSIRIDLAVSTPSNPTDRREALRAELLRRLAANSGRARSSPRQAKLKSQPPAPWSGRKGDPDRIPLPPGDAPPSHVSWEYYDAKAPGWRPLLVLSDPTRGLTLDGTIDLHIPEVPTQGFGANSGYLPDPEFGSQPYQYIRCRLVEGRPDSAPQIARIEIHAAVVAQSIPAMRTIEVIKPKVLPGVGELWRRVPLVDLASILAEAYVHVGPSNEDQDAAKTKVVARYAGVNLWSVPADIQGPTAPEPDGTTHIFLSSSAIIASSLRLVTLEPDETSATDLILRAWEITSNPITARSCKSQALFDTGSGELRFGDDRYGRSLPRGSFVLVTYDTTLAAQGGPPPRRRFFLPGLTEPRIPLTQPERDQLDSLAAWNRGLWGKKPESNDPITKLTAFSGDRIAADIARAGADAETLNDALSRLSRAARAASDLSSVAAKHGGTIDGADALKIAHMLPPSRAAVGADFEKLAMQTPGSDVRRARAFEGTDPRYPGLSTPGGITLVILPELPLDRPTPTDSLLSRVASYANGVRVVGSRLTVIAPTYVPISVSAIISITPGRSVVEVVKAAEADLKAWLAPLTWPFRRTPTAAEILARLAAVEGVSGASSVRLNVPPAPLVPWTLPYWDQLKLVPNGNATR